LSLARRNFGFGRLSSRRSISVSLRVMSGEEKFRVEKDTMGELKVPAEKYWGAQTQRSIQNFPIGNESETMPFAVVKGLAIVKKAAATINTKYGLDKDISEAIIKAADEVEFFRFSHSVTYADVSGYRWNTEGSFPIGCMANRKWHTIQHECKRSYRQSSH